MGLIGRLERNIAKLEKRIEKEQMKIENLHEKCDIIKHNSLNCEYLGHYVDYFDKYDSKVWYEIVDKPPRFTRSFE